jgi:hypothetical protein
MNGTRDFGLPASTCWLWRWTATRPRPGSTGDDHEALAGFASHDVKNN